MLFSFNELKKLANLPQNVDHQDVASAITDLGFEVESVNKFVDVEGIKFGKIIDLNKNPEADKLNVCQVEFTDKSRVIQTNATNLKVGDIVIAFVPGAKVGEMTFEAKELKGIVSEGMLSAPSEFGIDKDLCRPEVIEGITTYNEVTDLNLDPIEYLGLDDYIIEVDILSNRSDANSYYVMALELAAKFNTKVNLPEIKKGNMDSAITVKADELVMMETENNFSISIKEQIFLNKHNIKSINNAADITNLTLIYSGQPVHAYDADLVGNDFGIAKHSGFVTVFGNKQVELKDDLVVTADNKAVSVASVIGLEDHATTKETKRLKLELGIFNIKDVRQSVKAVKLNSLASSQGSKKLTRGTTEMALRYLSNKLVTFSDPINFNSLQSVSIDYDKKIINRLAGFEIFRDHKYESVLQSLSTLGFVIDETSIKAPNYRHDFENSSDLAEEIFRFYGYDNFKPLPLVINPSPINKVTLPTKKFVAQGYQEVVTYTLVSHEKNLLNPFEFEDDVSLETFVSKEREVIRNSQVISLLEIAEYNHKRGMKNYSLVSSGMINDGQKTIALLTNQKDLHAMQQDIVNILPGVKFERLISGELHPGVSANILIDNKKVGWIGKVHPSLTTIDAFVAELKIEAFKSTNISFKEYSEEPLKFEDITIALESKEDLSNKLKEYDAYEVKVIDEYQDGEILKVTIRVTK